jgi:acetylornithine aminotransferase
MRSIYAAKREVMLPALEASGLKHVGGHASFFLWMQTPEPDEQQRVLALVEKGIICAGGSAFGAPGAGHVRFALVPTLEQCRRAADLLAA